MLSNSTNGLKQQQQMHKNRKYTHITKVIKRILIVNAEADVNLALKAALEECDGGYFRVDSFNDPLLALKNYKNGFYDLLLIDIIMPQMNGFELSEKIRKVDDRAKICFLTAGEVPGEMRFDPAREEVFPASVSKDRFIRLPLENEELVNQVGKIVDS